MKNILIAGGTGLIGTSLCDLFLARGYQVSILSRKAHHDKQVSSFLWDVESGYIDKEALYGQDYIINLAGAPIAKRWTKSHKKQILDSRVQSAALIRQAIGEHHIDLKKYIGASAIGVYPSTKDKLTEDSPPGSGYLPEVCRAWEEEAMKFKSLGIPVAVVRTGIVLSGDGGFLDKVSGPIRFGVGAALGRGSQYISWIHIDDLCRLYLHLVENAALTGIFNGVSPSPVTNKHMMKAVAHALHRHIYLPPVPGFILNILYGEMSVELLASHNISAAKVMEEGFHFEHPLLEEALAEIYGSGQ